MSMVPGFGMVKGMALTLRRFFAPKATIQYPEVPADVAVRFRGRLQLLHDEWGALKCETCFQCAQACPIECIDMGGRDTRGRFHVHWGPPETYAERREESALRRAGRTVPDRAYTHFAPVDLSAVDRILETHDFDPKEMLPILEEVEAEYGHLPVAALKQIAFVTGSWYAFIYGTASYYAHLHFDRPVRAVQVCRCTNCLLAGAGPVVAGLAEGLETELGRPVPAGIRLEQLLSHLPDAPSPLVAVDGEPVPGVTATNAAAWARALAGKTAA